MQDPSSSRVVVLHPGHSVTFSIMSVGESESAAALFIRLRRPVLHTDVGSRHRHRPGSRPCEQPPRAGSTGNTGADYVVAFLRPCLQQPKRRQATHTKCRTVPT